MDARTKPIYPIRYKVPSGLRTYPVPERLRASLATLLTRRAELNHFPLPTSGWQSGNWYCASMPVYKALRDIEDELRRIANAPTECCVEYFRNYRFRCIDHHTARNEYLAACGKK